VPPRPGIQAGQHLPAADIPVSAAHRKRAHQPVRLKGWNQALAADEQPGECVETLHTPVPSAHGVLAERGGVPDVVVDPQSHHVLGDPECHGCRKAPPAAEAEAAGG
jgi:hypothetical protein